MTSQSRCVWGHLCSGDPSGDGIPTGINIAPQVRRRTARPILQRESQVQLDKRHPNQTLTMAITSIDTLQVSRAEPLSAMATPPGSTTALPLCSVAGPPLATSRHWTSVVSVVSFLSEPPTKCAEKVSTVELPGGRNAAVDGLRMFGPLVTCNSTGSPVTFSVTATLIQSTLQPPTQAAQSRNRRLGRRWWKRRGVPGEFLSAQRARDLATSEGEC
jgi:hypothetical protein